MFAIWMQMVKIEVTNDLKINEDIIKTKTHLKGLFVG